MLIILATKQTSEMKTFIGLKKAIASLSKEIAFLNKCKSSKIKSHRVNLRTSFDCNKISKIENGLLSYSTTSYKIKGKQKNHGGIFHHKSVDLTIATGPYVKQISNST